MSNKRLKSAYQLASAREWNTFLAAVAAGILALGVDHTQQLKALLIQK